MKEIRKTVKKFYAYLLVASMALGLCFPETVYAAEKLSAAETEEITAETASFLHPGLLHTQESFEKIKQNVGNQVQPNLDTWNLLLSDGFSASDWEPRAVETVDRGGDIQNYARFYIDIRRAYQTALVWKIGGSEEHRQAAIRIANAWADTMTEITGSADRFLAAGIYGYQLANVAELLREEPDFHLEEMQELLLNVFYPMNDDFLTNHNGAHIGNYWANWDLCNLASMMAIGIFCDREDIFNQVVEYYKTGLGNGSLYNAMPFVYEDGTAQWQESGRDQGHSTLGISLCEAICEMAWNQGVDLYSLSDYRFLKGAEYVARYNSGGDVEYSAYEWLKGQTGSSEWQSEVSEASRGSTRPIYTMVYNHYVKRMGLSAPNIENVLFSEDGTYTIEGAQSNGDELGWQTLTFANLYEEEPLEATELHGDFEDGVYRIRSVLSGKSIVVGEDGNLASASEGTKDTEWWIFSNTGDGEYVIKNYTTGMVMEITENYYEYLSVIGTGEDAGSLNQRFAVLKNSTGDYRIIPSANFYCLDILDLNTADDTPIIQYRYYSGEGQRWIIESYDYVKNGAEEAEKIKQARSKLKQFLEGVYELEEGDYTPDSWSALSDAVKQAQTIQNELEVSSEALIEATDAISAAMEGLIPASLATPEPNPTDTPDSTGIPNPTPTKTPDTDHVSHVGKIFVVNGLKYKVTKDDENGREVRITSMKSKKSTLTIPAKITNSNWGEGFKVTSIKAKAFKGASITKVTIGKNVTKIGPNAFMNCKKLKTVTIGKSVKTIGTRAFYGCTKLTKITIKSKVLKNVKKNAFKKISKKAVIKVATGKKTAYKKKLKGKIAKSVTVK